MVFFIPSLFLSIFLVSSSSLFWSVQFLCSPLRPWSTVSTVSQRGQCGSVIPFIRGPWVALVYPNLSLEITTCSLLAMPLASPSYSCSIFLPFMLLLPFLHRSFLIFFSDFSRSFGGYSSFCCLPSSSAAFASSSACSFQGMPTHVSWYPQECYLFSISVHHLP
jgi:hypothetical protein